MATRYVDPSAPFNGDGTAPGQAASAGAAGAYNSFAKVFGNITATAAAGDVFYVKTYNALAPQLTTGASSVVASLATNIYESAGINAGVGLTGKNWNTTSGLTTGVTYYFKVNYANQGVTEKFIVVGADTTFAAIVPLMNAQMTGVLAGVVWTLQQGDLLATYTAISLSVTISNTTLVISAGTSGTNLFASLTGFSALATPTTSIATTSSAAGTRVAPITFIFDNGTYGVSGWSNNGVLTLNGHNGSIILNSYANLEAFNSNFVYLTFMFTGGGPNIISIANSTVTGIKSYTLSSTLSNSGCRVFCGQGNAQVYGQVRNCVFVMGCGGYGASTQSSFGLLGLEQRSSVTYVGCTFDFICTLAATYTKSFCSGRAVFDVAGGRYEFIGCNFLHTDNTIFLSGSLGGQQISMDSCSVGAIVMDSYDSSSDNVSPTGNFSLSNNVGTIGGAFYGSQIGSASWVSGANYPILTGIQPNVSRTYWTWKVLQKNAALGVQSILPSFSKYYTTTAASKTITLNLLLPSTWTTPYRNEYWIDVTFVDSAGNLQFVSSRQIGNPSALSQVNGGWSLLFYGPLNYTPYQLSVSTVGLGTGLIKQESIIKLRYYSLRTPVSSTDYYFADSDMVLS